MILINMEVQNEALNKIFDAFSKLEKENVEEYIFAQNEVLKSI
jgi:hypothetical protein